MIHALNIAGVFVKFHEGTLTIGNDSWGDLTRAHAEDIATEEYYARVGAQLARMKLLGMDMPEDISLKALTNAADQYVAYSIEELEGQIIKLQEELANVKATG